MVDITFGCAGIKMDNIPFHFQRLGMEGNSKSAQIIIRNNIIKQKFLSLIGRDKIKRNCPVKDYKRSNG